MRSTPTFVAVSKPPQQEENPERTERLRRMGFEPGDYYFAENGYIVFTEQYHLKRGHCCQSGCKHCPYGFHEKRKKGKAG